MRSQDNVPAHRRSHLAINDTMEVKMKYLRSALLISSLSICSFATAQGLPASTPDVSAQDRFLVDSSKEFTVKMAAIKLAIEEALRLDAGSCNASDPRLCGPTPPCDVQGKRGYPWQDCVLAWDDKENGKGKLVWVDDGVELDFGNYRRVRLGSDGKLY
jgi:hypothetical protein